MLKHTILQYGKCEMKHKGSIINATELKKETTSHKSLKSWMHNIKCCQVAIADFDFAKNI